MATPTRQTAAFPEVAIIRKGTPKQKGQVKNGKDTWIQGKDLKNKFRINFLPGAEKARAAFHAKHEKDLVKYGDKFAIADGYEVKELRAMIPFADAFAGWAWGNEAYNSGRRIAIANDEYYIERRDPLTGTYLVRDGEPKEAFRIGDTITYTRGGHDYSLPVKFHGNLRVFLPEIEQFASFTLKTTSFYDRTTIEANLGAIQGIANILNNGISGGIPFHLYRAEKDVAWNHKDGTASRTKIWSIFLRVDEEWVKAAMKRMSDFALTGSQMAGLLQAPDVQLKGEADPQEETFDDETIVDSSFVPDEEIVITTPLPRGEVKTAKAGNNDSRIWTVAQRQVLIDNKLADNDFAAKGMLGLSGLPQDATEAEVLQWGTIYRTCRDSIDPSTGKKHLAPVAAAFADEEVLALKVDAA